MTAEQRARVRKALADTHLDFQGEPLSMNATPDDIDRLADNAIAAFADAPGAKLTKPSDLVSREAAAKVAEQCCYNPPRNAEEGAWNEATDHIAAALRSMPGEA